MDVTLHSVNQELNSDQIQEYWIKIEFNKCRVSYHILRLTIYLFL
jgi:hypothetical protein